MGASASVSGNPHGAGAKCTFVDESLLKDETAFKHDPTLRHDYIEFIKGGAWADCLERYEDFSGISHNPSETAWKRFGYKTPNSSDSPSVRSSFASSTRSSSSTDNLEPASNAAYQKMILNDFYSAISSNTLFEKNELRSVLLVALLPFFKQSTDEPGGPDTFVLNNKPFKRPKKDRLQALLLGAAAMFDSSELEAYLADPNVKWVEDYRKAISNLPVMITVSTVDPTARESKIVYSNAQHLSLFGSNKSQIGKNLHELFSTNCSPNGVEQITKSIFSAKIYKRGILGTDNLCQLRALKPVFDSSGKHALMLGVESRPFEDSIFPIRLGTSTPPNNNDELFQQVDDLLLLLPMLIRTG